MGLQRVLGLDSYTTAWTWLHKIRTAMVNPNRTKLCGTVEVDETYIGGVEEGGKTGRGTENKTLVAIAVELPVNSKALGRIRLQVVPDAGKKALQGFVKANVESGSTVITDGWASYFSLTEEGYPHVVQKTSNEAEILPHVHMIASHLKRWLLGTHQGAVRDMHLQSYLDEFVFRFNRRKSASRGLLFYRLLEGAVQTQPTTQDKLLGHNIL